MLNIYNHDRDAAGLRYVYPVISRRASGVSIGINLNPNRACSWRCVYCQVEGLTRGVSPAIDLTILKQELYGLLTAINSGDFMQKHVPSDCRVLRDIALSGDGEPTSCRQFHAVTKIITEAILHFNLQKQDVIPRIITNGGYVHRPDIQKGLANLAKSGGEAWFKIDAIKDADIWQTNGVHLSWQRQKKQLISTLNVIPAWIQTCMFANSNHEAPSEKICDYYIEAMLECANDARVSGHDLRGILLYGIARQPQQGEDIHPVNIAWLESFADKLRKAGLCVKTA
ncbi:MAG: radical SAM protein [Mariprofundales bacterium]